MHEPLKIGVVYNGTEGSDALYINSEFAIYTLIRVSYPVNVNLDDIDVLLVPNGCDHVFMYRIKDDIKRFLNQGKTLLCFDGWFTDWIPGNKWIMDNTKKSIDVKINVHEDPYSIMKDVDINHLNRSNGISGWWACGYIEPAVDSIIILKDTWNRPLLVLDECPTKGVMILSASAPISDNTYATTSDKDSAASVAGLYRNIINYLYNKKHNYATS